MINSEASGFLPPSDPLLQLPDPFAALERMAAQLPKLLLDQNLRADLSQLPPLPIDQLVKESELERAMLLLSFLGHAYVWGAKTPVTELPSALAVPWHAVATKLQRLPVLSYASYALHNWRQLDPAGPVALGNIALLQNFLGGVDEEWFVLVHIEIERRAASGLAAIPEIISAVAANDLASVESHLKQLGKAISAICNTLDRMPERCDPYIYFNRVRPYIHGWKNHPALPEGLIYQGVEEYENRPQQFRGETGAQSTVIPSFDAILGIQHKKDQLSEYLAEMRNYMPPVHREFLSDVEKRANLRSFVLANASHSELKSVYNECVRGVVRFRRTHLAYAAQYIEKQAMQSEANPNATGTAGTPFMRYLAKHLREVEEHVI